MSPRRRRPDDPVGDPAGPAEAAEREWRAAVGALYEMTRFDHPRGPVEGCPHCVGRVGMESLMGVPREDAPAEGMDRFGFKAMTTVGTEREFRWFLPRLVEVLGDDPGGIADESVLVGKLEYAGWSAWPDEERDAVRRAFVALWRLWIDGGRHWRLPWWSPDARRPIEADDILAALARLGVDVAPLVDEVFARARNDRDLAEEAVWLAESIAAAAEATNPFEGDLEVATALLDEAAIARLDALALELAEVDTGPAALGDRLLYVTERLERRRGRHPSG
jgi:hypothetical protein